MSIIKINKMDIIGYEGKYKIYEDGRVWSYKREIFLKAFTNKIGYYQLDLRKDNKRKMFKLHRLLALHFIPNPNNLPQVDHIDRNRKNNDLSNLQWVTSQENNENKGMQKNNQLGEKHIFSYRNGYMVKIERKGIRKQKYFKKLEDAIDYRDSVLMYYEIHKTLEGI
tara:strand:- start:1268 stop:1768 length:501 start_codon:yes stop_codon:yes gene_type:complete